MYCQQPSKGCSSNDSSGLADLFEEASAVLKSSEDMKQTAESLRKVLALSSAYNKVKAWQAMAAHEAAQSDMGIACADLQVLHLLACCPWNLLLAHFILHWLKSWPISCFGYTDALTTSLSLQPLLLTCCLNEWPILTGTASAGSKATCTGKLPGCTRNFTLAAGISTPSRLDQPATACV